ncbi:phage major capsid protein [Solwaraspora sp. WMMD1047]|uniref:major capsid protein n=1 Tax=Solwaraspora sp. WMMD1047 TaxID=3016102 RepID=UPI002416545D|nr:phage major capsid protein [Solwaraspora sp. WMMD1047]MDG4832421.1 phage major capsid protein [Solwaraspora sp. WMMD1047]
MPVTLAQAQVNTQADVDYAVIDNLRRYSWLLDQIVFDDTVTPGTGGTSLTYSYTRLITAAAAAFRAINSEYTPGKATRQRYSVDLKPLGGAFEVDRVIAQLGAAATNEVTFQMQQLLTSTRIRFQQELIHGDIASDDKGFDGLDQLLTGSSTERTASEGMADITPGTITTQALAMAALDELDEWLATIVPSTTGGGDLGTPGALPPGVKAILGNTRSITRVKALARWAGIYSEDKDSVGRQVMRYGDWALVDIGDRADGSTSIIPIVANDTDLYAVTFGLDSVHAASPANVPLVQTWLPEFDRAGAVKTGEVEMGPAALVVKSTKSAGVLRGVQVSG